MQLRNNSSNPLQKFNQQLPPVFVNEQLENSPDFQYYIEKTYMKTASLIAKSCQAATILGGCDEAITDAAYSYGRNLGLAFQVH